MMIKLQSSVENEVGKGKVFKGKVKRNSNIHVVRKKDEVQGAMIFRETL